MGPKFIRKFEAHLRQAEGRRPKAWERERSEQHSTRSVFISEWTLAGGPYVYSTQSTLARSIFINTRGQLSLREIQKSWGKFQKKSRKSPERVQKKSRKSPEKVQKKSRKSPEKDQNHPRVCSEKSRENAEEVQKKFPENQFLKKSIIYSIHLKGKVNDYLMMRQYSCGILPTFLSLEAHQGKIISYVTAIWKPQWDFQITVTAKKCFAFHSLYNFKRSPLNLIIITHLCYKTMLRVNQGSSWGKEQSTCTIVELCVRFCQILELLSRVREREKVCVERRGWLWRRGRRRCEREVDARL